ncbi:MAG: hypothetical protein KGH72_04310 [Candidatus Micrarchaeota archaeon]|nr:hypothetical protein [Candidatus Micrarchaeota archaeon]
MIRKRNKPHFIVPNFGAPNRKRIKDRWRRQRGIDNKKRVKKKESGPTPSIGYKNGAEVRYHRPDGSTESLVHNEMELMTLIGMKNVSARLAHDISRRKRFALQKVADQHGIRIVNRVQI